MKPSARDRLSRDPILALIFASESGSRRCEQTSSRVILNRETSSQVSHGERPAGWLADSLAAVRSAGKRRPYGSTGPFFRHILGRPLPPGTPSSPAEPRATSYSVAERRADNSN